MIDGCGIGGMTLRDYYAAKAMQSLIIARMDMSKDQPLARDVVREAFLFADAMLAARTE